MEKLSKMVKALLVKTQRGELDWQESSVAKSYHLSFPTNSVRIREATGRNGGTDYFLDIINADGQMAESVSDVALDQWQIGMDPSHFKMMQELFASARRVAFGAEKVIDDILGRLT